MIEVLQEAISWQTLPLTVLLGFILLFWVLVSVGVMDADMFNADFDADVDLDVDMDVDADADAGLGHHIAEMDLDSDLHHDAHHHAHADADGHGGLGMAVLRFLNFGQVPAMVIVSVLSLSLWTISVITNHYLNPFDGIFMAMSLFAGNLFVSAFITKFATAPLKPLMRALNKDYDTHEKIVGRTCTVRSLIADGKGGQGEVERSGATFLINVRVSDGEEPIKRGTEALVVHHDDEKDIYVIRNISMKQKKED